MPNPDVVPTWFPTWFPARAVTPRERRGSPVPLSYGGEPRREQVTDPVPELALTWFPGVIR